MRSCYPPASTAKRGEKFVKEGHSSVVEALVYGIICEHRSEAESQAAIKRFGDYFVDLNDLRVSRPAEIVEQLGEDTPVTRDIAIALKGALRAVFDEYNSVSLESLKKMGKRPAKQALEKIEGVSRFVADYCMLTALQGHAIPLTQKMMEYLRSNKLVQEGANEQDVGGFLAKQISAKNGYEFYTLLRSESESPIIKLMKTKMTKKMKK